MSNTIQCPQCSHQFEITEALLRQVSQQAQVEIETRLQAEREKIVRDAEARVAEAAKSAAEERKASEEASRKLREEAVTAAVRLEQERQATQATLQAQREELNRKSIEALTKQLGEMQEQNQRLAESQRLAEITARQQAEAAAQQRITQVTGDIEQRLKQESELRVQELNLQLESLRSQVAVANQRANQISQQNQGAALEASIEEQLRTAFSGDKVSDVPAGVNGADVMLDVVNDAGAVCGRILLETKRTQAWSNDWTGKLGEDLHRAKADIGVLITQTMPRDMKTTGIRDGVWVSDFASAMTLIRSLRWGIQEAHLQKRIAGQSGEASAMLYDFVTSTDFRNRVQTILKTYASMRETLMKERRAMEKIWKTRDQQLDDLAKHTTHVITGIETKTGHQLEDDGTLMLEDAAGDPAGDDIDIDFEDAAPTAARPALPQITSEDLDQLEQLGDFFLSKLRKLGGSAGNKAMRFELIWDAEKFERVKQYLIEEELIVTGRGRGGSVSLPGYEKNAAND
jgi:hypothetical protein